VPDRACGVESLPSNQQTALRPDESTGVA